MAERSSSSGRSCQTAAETGKWIGAIIDFIKHYTFLLDAHVVNFFKDRLWEAIDEEWIDCLRHEPVENLLKIPSGVVQDHWPASLQQFIFTSRSLVFPRQQADLQTVFQDLRLCTLDSILTQGMNGKKRHEVEALSAVVSSVSRSIGSPVIVDVGAGQGYLAQVLSFQLGLSVVAIDASSHHGNVTGLRARRIKKHYAAKMLKSSNRSEDRICNLDGPRVITSRVLSSDALNALSGHLLKQSDLEQPHHISQFLSEPSSQENDIRIRPSPCTAVSGSSLLLAGLHACGDLSVTMLRTFLECKEIQAVISIGCCYNLLSIKGSGNVGCPCGFPMSKAVVAYGVSLGKNSLDLACQSAERWRHLEEESGIQNFELHACRAAFQMLLERYYPEVVIKSPAIGRQGKALRRKQQKKNLDSLVSCGGVTDEESIVMSNSSHGPLLPGSTGREGSKSMDKYDLFERFSHSGLSRLGLECPRDLDLYHTWQETEPFSDLIGPYWSLRAALGPVVETLLLLDRLMFLQEQGSSLEAVMVPIFDPTLSPRNVAIIAKKC